MGLYDATKAGLLAFTRTLAHDEAANAIRVNAICPGSTLTDFHIHKAVAVGKDLALLQTERQTTSLLGRSGRDRLAGAVVVERRGIVHHRHHLDGGRRLARDVR